MENFIKVITNPKIEMVKGFKSNGVMAGIKKSSNKIDLGIVYFENEADGFGMFTKNRVKAAPILVSQKHIKNKIRLLVVNSGNANACTGQGGINDALLTCKECAEHFNVPLTSVIPMSTGVIGQRLPINVIMKGISELKKVINEPNDNNFAKAIMTTDTKMKIYGVKVETPNYQYSIVGVAKGSGMIHPNMATMLGFIFTDVNIDKKLANKAFRKAVEKSFNSITVDGDTSTNDSVFLFANGLANNKKITNKKLDYYYFEKALNQVTNELAKKIVEDGEGATKFIEITVKNAKSEKQAKKIAMSVATSNLVKTAFFGQDANWGRIICAVGYSGEKIKVENIKLYFDNLLLFKNGEPTNYSEEEALQILSKRDIKVTIDLDIGKKAWTVWTSDLSKEYVNINANYRT